MPFAGPLTYSGPWVRPQASSGLSLSVFFPPGTCLPWPILLMDFSGGTRKFPVAQGTGKDKRAGVHLPLGNWPRRGALSPGGRYPSLALPTPQGPQLRTFLVENVFLKEVSNLVTTAQEIVFVTLALGRGDIRGTERASQGQSWGWPRGKRILMLPNPPEVSSQTHLLRHSEQEPPVPGSILGSPSIKFPGNHLISHMILMLNTV